MLFAFIPWRIRLKIMFVVLTVGFLFSGFNSLSAGMKYRHPVSLAYAQFEQQHPTAGWFTITDATLDMDNAVASTGSHRNYYIPLTVNGVDPKMMDTEVVVSDSTLVGQIDAYNNAHNKTMTTYGMVHTSSLGAVPTNTTIAGPISGMVIGESPSTGMLEIDYNSQPSALKGIAMIVGGLIMCVGVLWSFGLQPSVSGVKQTIQDMRGGGNAPAPYGGYNNTLPSAYSNSNSWQQNTYSQSPGQYQQPGQPYAAPTPPDAWSPTGGQTDSPYSNPPEPTNHSQGWSPAGQQYPPQQAQPGQPQPQSWNPEAEQDPNASRHNSDLDSRKGS